MIILWIGSHGQCWIRLDRYTRVLKNVCRLQHGGHFVWLTMLVWRYPTVVIRIISPRTFNLSTDPNHITMHYQIPTVFEIWFGNISIQYITRKIIVKVHFRKRLWNIWKARWYHSYVIFWFPGNGLTSTTNKYCYFTVTLTCSVMGQKEMRFATSKIIDTQLTVQDCIILFLNTSPQISATSRASIITLHQSLNVCFYGLFQTIYIKSKCQIRVFQLCIPNIPISIILITEI